MENKVYTLLPGQDVVPEPLACINCGDTEDVIEVIAHCGGNDFEITAQCRDAIACWIRWDQQHGM